MAGQTDLNAIRTMLAACAPGHTIERKLHHFWIRYDGKKFEGIRKGKGHSDDNPDVPLQVVKHMIRHLGINMDCAKRHLPSLR